MTPPTSPMSSIQSTNPVAIMMLQSCDRSAPPCPNSPSRTHATVAPTTILEWPREKKRPTVTGRRPCATRLRVTENRECQPSRLTTRDYERFYLSLLPRCDRHPIRVVAPASRQRGRGSGHSCSEVEVSKRLAVGDLAGVWASQSATAHLVRAPENSTIANIHNNPLAMSSPATRKTERPKSVSRQLEVGEGEAAPCVESDAESKGVRSCTEAIVAAAL